MALKTYTAKAELIEGLKVRASARDFSVVLDEPLEQGGTNAGMNPIELALPDNHSRHICGFLWNPCG